MDSITIVFLLLVIAVWYFWIRAAKEKLQIWRAVRNTRLMQAPSNSKNNKSVSIGFRYLPVRLSGDMPEFEGMMFVNEKGQCTTSGPVLKLDKAQMRTWHNVKAPNGYTGISFEILGKSFDVLPDYNVLAEEFFTKELNSLLDVKFPEDL